MAKFIEEFCYGNLDPQARSTKDFSFKSPFYGTLPMLKLKHKREKENNYGLFRAIRINVR